MTAGMTASSRPGVEPRLKPPLSGRQEGRVPPAFSWLREARADQVPEVCPAGLSTASAGAADDDGWTWRKERQDPVV
ncbi:hypothetical protein [Methylobacterium tarhaniae]|uniref:hypothetical protein n=1 Tax=Methylobacterium tarhaniae TaxID=1187852 RepID=UPI000A458894|nr:hypothetical protein [Methylobacterium tarhaniae]